MIFIMFAGLFAAPVPSFADHEDDAWDSTWQLVSYGIVGAETDVIPGSLITLTFDELMSFTVRGSGGCNFYYGDYSPRTQSIEFSHVERSLRTCFDHDVMAQERTYFEALQAVNAYEMSDTQLILLKEDGFRLIFTKTSTLTNVPWRLNIYGTIGYETHVIVAGSITINFSENNQVSGSSGCNTYNGDYSAENNSIEFTQLINDLQVCSDEATTKQEQSFFRLLESARNYSMFGDYLLISDYEERLLFLKASSLIQSGWQLVSGSIEIAPTITDPVTLWFGSEWVVKGKTSCNFYKGQYANQANLIAFRTLYSTPTTSCPGNQISEQEQLYFDALQSAQYYSVDGDELTIAYADGQTLIFSRLPDYANF